MKKSKKSGGPKAETLPRVAVIMGSDSDLKVMQDAVEVLEQFQVGYELKVVSAHRTPEDMFEFAISAQGKGLRVIIAGAGGAAHLPGMVAALTELPVIGVPVPNGPLQGEDALLSIVQMPKGVPVATVAIGNAYNAGLLAVKILGFGANDQILQQKIHEHRIQMRDQSRAKRLVVGKKQ